MGEDATMLDIVTSANIACGYHAGDARTILTTVEAAAASEVAIGAHVSYRDLAGFGRRYMDVDPADLRADVLYQLAALAGLCAVVGTQLAYVKPHGALYHAVVRNRGQADAVAQAVADFDASLVLLGLPGACRDAAVRLGLETAIEAFADRAYAPDGTLVPRGRPGAVLTDPEAIAERVMRLATAGYVDTSEGLVAVKADSVCVHGDTPGAVTIARAVRERLLGAGVTLAPFASR